MRYTRCLFVMAALAALCAAQAQAGGHNLPSKKRQVSPGPPPLGTSFTAVVKGSGELVRGSGAVAASQPEGVGTYEVEFTADVTNCVYVATLGEPGNNGPAPPGDITVVGRSGDAEGVFVQTGDIHGNLKNRAFHIDVGC